jgi:predicted ester cyclase
MAEAEGGGWGLEKRGEVSIHIVRRMHKTDLNRPTQYRGVFAGSAMGWAEWVSDVSDAIIYRTRREASAALRAAKTAFPDSRFALDIVIIDADNGVAANWAELHVKE